MPIDNDCLHATASLTPVRVISKLSKSLTTDDTKYSTNFVPGVIRSKYHKQK